MVQSFSVCGEGWRAKEAVSTANRELLQWFNLKGGIRVVGQETSLAGAEWSNAPYWVYAITVFYEYVGTEETK